MASNSLLHKHADLAPGAEDRLQAVGESILEATSNGDYDVYLVTTRWLPYPQIGLQRKGRDMTDWEDQSDETAVLRGGFSLKKMKAQLLMWQAKYEHLLFASMNPNKTEKYIRLCKLMGFHPTEHTVMGYKVAEI